MSSDSTSLPSSSNPPVSEWKRVVAQFQEPSTARAAWQMVNTFGLYALLWVLMYWSAGVSYWIAVPLAIVTGGVFIRVFIIFHDCGHGSFLKSRVANALIGFICGMLTFTPYRHWRWEHSCHHANVADLDQRGKGDVWTMTVREYLASSPWRRLVYRVFRNPLFLFGLAPVLLFVFRERFPSGGASARDRRSVWWMNLALVLMVALLTTILGPRYLLLQLFVMAVGGSIGVWIFYIQHQFEDVYWARGEAWDQTAAALQGSSYFQLPRILQWFTGNIGFHHIHHLSSRIPNYNLERCHNAHPSFSQVKGITFWESLKSVRYRLWDEDGGKLVGFDAIRHLARTYRSGGECA